MKISNVACMAITFMILRSACASADLPLNRQLEKVRKDYYAAVKARDVEKVRQRLSAYQFSITANQATIRKRTFSEYFFTASRQDHADLGQLTRYATLQRNDTVCQSYYSITRMTDVKGEYKNQLSGIMLVVHFVRENGQWKYDEESMMYLSPDDCRRIVRKQKNSWIIQQVIQPYGKVRPPQPLVKPLPFLGIVKVSSSGFKTRIKINGGSYVTLTGEALPVYVGLRSGVNQLSIIAEPIEGAATEKNYRPEVEIFASRSEGMFSDGTGVFKLRLGDFKGITTTQFMVEDKKIPASPDGDILR